MQRIRLSIVSATPLELSSPLCCFLRTIYSTKLRLTPICWSFRSLHSEKPLNPTQQSVINNLTYLESRKDQMASLDYFITENEIVTAAKRMKNNKSSFTDRIKNEMIKASLQDMMLVYLKLFNSILISGKCPRRGVAALLHQYINQVIEVICQIIGEFVFQAV